MKATGVNFATKASMIKLHEQGYTPKEISRDIQVEEECVAGWIKALYPKEEKVKEAVKKVAKKTTTKKAEESEEE